MDFSLTEDQSSIIKMVKDFATEQIAPRAGEMDEIAKYDDAIIKQLAELGLFGMLAPDELGGIGLDTVTYSMVIEELSKVCGSTGVIVAAHNSLVLAPILDFGTKEQIEKYVPDLASGDKIGAHALTEPEAGSDAGNLNTVAVPTEGGWILNGTKLFITNAEIAKTFIIFAKTKAGAGTRGISAFIVEMGAEGFKIGSHENKMGIRASSTCELIFEDCFIPTEALLGEINKGFKVAMQTLDGGRISIGAQAVGLAQGSLDAAVAYSQTREQFSMPICNFQAIQWLLADMNTEIDAARLLVLRAGSLKDNGKRVSREAAQAKMYASEMAVRNTSRAIQILGGYGYTKEFPVERLFRDARITPIYEGTSEIQRMVIATPLLKS